MLLVVPHYFLISCMIFYFVYCLIIYWYIGYFPFSGSKDCGVVHVWLVHAGQAMENEIPVKRGLARHVQSLEGHSAPITCLEFSESAALLASGCKAGSVRIWDLKVGIIFMCSILSVLLFHSHNY